MMQQRQAWQPTFDQEGGAVSPQQVQQEHLKLFQDMLEEKRVEFEETLADRCKKDDEVFNKMGFQEQIGAICYQVGMGVYALMATPDGIHAQQVGQIG